MIIKPVLIFVFWFLAVYGAFNMVRGARKMRATRTYKDAVFAWSERPLPSYKYDPIAWAGISIHGLSAVLIGLIVILNLMTRPFHPVASSFLMMLILVGLVAMVGQIWGSVFFYPVALSLAGDRYIALSTEGVLWAGNLVPWSAFSYFSVNHEHKIIRLWSASLRGTIAFMFTPPKEHISGIIEILQGHLPSEHGISPPSVAEQYVLPIAMGIGCIPIVIAAYLMSELPLEITLIVNGILLYARMILGGPVLLRSLLGKNFKTVPLE